MGDNPWNHAASKYYVGSKVTGVVSRVMDFGAFVKLEPGIEGMIHISELNHGRVFRVSDVLSEGQEVEVKVMAVDVEKQRIGLSLKALYDRAREGGSTKSGRRRFTAASRRAQAAQEKTRTAQRWHQRTERRREVWIELVRNRSTKSKVYWKIAYPHCGVYNLDE